MQAGRDVLIELPLATTMEDAHRIVATWQATGRRAFVDMFSRFSPGNQKLRQAVAERRYGPLMVLEIEGRTALLWEGYDLGLDTLALDMMHADFDLVTGLLGHVLACLTGHASNLIEPATALPALELTLAVHQRLTHPVS